MQCVLLYLFNLSKVSTIIVVIGVQCIRNANKMKGEDRLLLLDYECGKYFFFRLQTEFNSIKRILPIANNH